MVEYPIAWNALDVNALPVTGRSSHPSFRRVFRITIVLGKCQSAIIAKNGQVYRISHRS